MVAIPQRVKPIEQTLATKVFQVAAEVREKRRRYLGFSQIGHPCKRKLWYHIRGFHREPFDGRTRLIFELGHALEDVVIRHLQAAGHFIEGVQEGYACQGQLEYEDYGGWFMGHPDGIIHDITSQAHILEIKSASKTYFEKYTSGTIAATSETYNAQVQCNMGYSGLKRTLWAVICKNNCDLYFERHRFDKAQFEALQQKAQQIILSHRAPGKLPDSHPEKWFQCQKMCEFKALCEGEYTIMGKEDRHCGTCEFLGWRSRFRTWCRHPKHPLEIPKKHFGSTGCPEWVELWQKAIPPGSKRPHPDPVDLNTMSG